MKRLLLLVATCAAISTKAQTFEGPAVIPFIGMAIGNTVNANAGVLANGLEVAIEYKQPYSSTVRPSVTSLTIGYMFESEEQFSLTFSAGGAMHAGSRLEEIEYDNGRVADVLTKFKDVRAIYGVEAGKVWHMGKLYVDCKYSGRFYGSAGIKFLFNQ